MSDETKIFTKNDKNGDKCASGGQESGLKLIFERGVAILVRPWRFPGQPKKFVFFSIKVGTINSGTSLDSREQFKKTGKLEFYEDPEKSVPLDGGRTVRSITYRAAPDHGGGGSCTQPARRPRHAVALFGRGRGGESDRRPDRIHDCLFLSRDDRIHRFFRGTVFRRGSHGTCRHRGLAGNLSVADRRSHPCDGVFLGGTAFRSVPA